MGFVFAIQFNAKNEQLVFLWHQWLSFNYDSVKH